MFSPLRRHHVVGPVPDLHLRAGGAEVAVRAEPGIDAVLVAEAPDRGDALLAGAAERERLGVPEPAAQLAERAPPAVDEPAVASAGAAPADVLLEQDDVQLRLRFLQEPRRPHPGVAAAEDRRRPRSCRGPSGGAGSPGSAASASRNHQLRPASAGIGRGFIATAGYRTVRADRRSSRLVRCVPSPVPPGGPRHGRRPPSQLGGHRRTPTRAGARHVARGGVLRGGLRQVADRRGVVVERGDAVQLPPGQARGAREGGRPAGRRGAHRVHDDRGLRRDRDGSRGHEGVADQPRGDRRLGRARDACRAVRRARGDRRLRQERAGHADGDGAAEPAGRLPVRRHDPRRAPTRTATSRSRTCSRRSARTGTAR